MLFETTILAAAFYGMVSAATLPLGALIGVFWRPPERFLAFLLAFGGGALLAALTIDLIAPGVQHGYFPALAAGAICGGFLFKLLDYLVNRQGGYLRKPSTAMTYWQKQARAELRRVLKNMRRAIPLGEVSEEVEETLLSLILVRKVSAGACLYRAGDPSNHLYIVDEGKVELRDSRRDGEVIAQPGRYDVFGRMGFYTGLPRTTEAHTLTDTRLLIIPRVPFLESLADSSEMRQLAISAIEDPGLRVYLRDRHHMDEQSISAWQQNAVVKMREEGRIDPPLRSEEISDDLLALLRGENRLEFFAGLSGDTLQLIADRLVHKHTGEGYNFFHQGHVADRFYILRRGTVHLIDPADPSHEPCIVRPGDSFGGLSFLTGGRHAATAVARDDTEVSLLLHQDFEELLDSCPELRHHLVEYLRRSEIESYLTRQQNLDARRAARWVDKASKSIEGGKIFPSLAELTRHVEGHAGAAMAIFIGITLDGIPESMVIGANVLSAGTVSLSLLGGLFLSNFPEALSSAAGMKEQGMRIGRIIGMWGGLCVFTGVGAALGSMLLKGAPETVFAVIEGVAAGAMLTVVAETMLPEAFHKGGGVVGISTLAGFLATVGLTALM